jgi:hypothetical protein
MFMSSIAWIILIFVIALIFGLTLLIVPILAYYWGPNGRLPTSQEERKRLREEELKIRAEQIEKSKNNPVMTRKPSFWDNRKVYNRNKEQ